MTILCWSIDFCATFLELFLFLALLETIFQKHKRMISAVLSLMTAVFTILLLNQIALFSHLNLLFLFLILSAWGCLIVREEYFAIISMASFYVLCLGCYDFFYASILMAIPRFGEDVLSAVLQIGWFRIFFIVTCKLGNLALFLLIRFWIRRTDRGRFTALQMILISVGGYIGFIYIVQQTFTAYTPSVSKLWIMVFAALILLFFILLFEIDLRGKREKLEREQRNITLLEEKYQSLNEMYSQNAKLYHDLNNHLTVLDHLLEDGSTDAARQYLADISTPIRELRKITWTGNDIVDVILNNKIESMKKAGISYRIHAEFPDGTGIADADICTILSNLLDNAIEAVKKLSGENSIDIRIKNINRILLIQIKNPSSFVKITKDGIPHTSKKANGFHGWGLRNVAQAAEKYDGILQCEYKDGIFEAAVTLFY